MHTVSAVTKQSLKHEKIGDLSLYTNCIEERSRMPKVVEVFDDIKGTFSAPAGVWEWRNAHGI